jgi:hypothetical protein
MCVSFGNNIGAEYVVSVRYPLIVALDIGNEQAAP